MQPATTQIEKKNYIPDYDYLFQEEGKVGNKKKPKFIKKLLKMNFWSIVLATLLILIQESPVYIGSLLTADIINIISDSSRTEYLKPILIDAGIFLFLLLLNVPITYVRHVFVHKMSRNINAGVKSSVVRKLQSLSITYHKDMQTGRVQSKFLKDTDSVETLFLQISNSIIPNVILTLVYCAIAIFKSGTVSLFFLLVVPVNVFLNRVFIKRIRKSTKDFRVATEGLSHNLLNMVTMMPVTKSHGLEQNELVGFNNKMSSYVKTGLSFDKNIGVFGSTVFVVNESLRLLCLVFCCYLAIIGKIKIGDVVLYQTLFNSISSRVNSLIGILPSINVGLDAVNSVTEIMNIKDVEVNLKSGVVPKIDGEIEFANVTYTYPNANTPVIKNINLKVKKGECIAVVGASGSGKSTLMNVIIGFLKPQQGEVYIDNKPLSELNLSEYRHNVSVVPQNSILFAGSIKENITYGMSRYSEQDLETAVEKANLNEFITELENGIETNIGENGARLSGGQKQRITIARALIRNPKILILDEATSALDNISEYHVQKAINQSIQGRTTFIVAHRLSTIRNADKIIVLENGEIVESGTFEELIDKKGKFYELKRLNDINVKEAESALTQE